LIVIICLAAALSIGSYFYTDYAAGNIANSAKATIRSEVEVQASDMANILSGKLEAVTSNLLVISSSPSIQESNASGIRQLLSAAQNSTAPFTNNYSWINATGTLLESSNQTDVTVTHQANLNLSTRNYFVGAKETGATYIGSAFSGALSHIVIMTAAQPTYGSGHVFEGVVIASIPVSILAKLIQSETAPQVQASLSLNDDNGTVLYSSLDPSVVGLNAFSSAYNATIPQSLRPEYESLLRHAINSTSPGIGEVTYQGMIRAVAYQPVIVSVGTGNGGDQTRTEKVGTIFASLGEVIPLAQTTQITQLQLWSSLSITGIGLAAVIAALIALRWNGRLGALVDDRTLELATSNKELEERTQDLQRANQELVVREQNQKDVINIAAHELRTPVQPILAVTHVVGLKMNEKGIGPQGSRRAEISEAELGILQRSASRLESLTKNILDVSRLESGTFKLNRERFDLNEGAKEAIEELVPTASETSSTKSVTSAPQLERGAEATASAERALMRRSAVANQVEFSPSSEPLIVEADGMRIFEVISNLLRNALKFSAGGVEVSTSRDGASAVLRVRDYGSGISADLKPRLFDRFATKSDSGLGLGLYISKKIVEAHGGRIWGENNQDGKGGASFYFTLPLLIETGGEHKVVGTRSTSG
jgi:signal transduction histidine kinase